MTLMAGALMLLCGCQSMYYGAMEKVGYEKRDIMKSRVAAARDAQDAVKKQFQDALQEFGSVVKYEGGDLEAKYNELNRTLQRSEAKAEAVHNRIDDVEKVAEALFKEWRHELSEYGSESLRKDSEQKMKQTRARYDELMAAMKKAEKTIEPVLTPLRDQVLYLKHNLNARALSSIRNELDRVQSDVSSLVSEMNKSIAEADKFIRSLETD
jgi:predicted  nucleic acid-binding Zn-ribbon protein